MIDRVGEVWWARRRSVGVDYEPCVIIRVGRDGWMLRPLERIADAKEEFGCFESQFRLVEMGLDDAWIRGRIA